MITKREKQLATLLLKERLERLTGKKVILKEGVQRVTIDQMNDILTNTSPGTIIACSMIVKPRMNKFGKDEEGNKIANPYYDKVVKKNIYYGRINFDYAAEWEKEHGEKYVPSGRTVGEKQGALALDNGRYKLPLKDVESGKPEYEINGNPISKEELKPFMTPEKPRLPGEKTKYISPLMDNVKSIVIDNNEYQII